jgi:hypothetical protein
MTKPSKPSSCETCGLKFYDPCSIELYCRCTRILSQVSTSENLTKTPPSGPSLIDEAAARAHYFEGHACRDGDCPHEKQVDCFIAAYLEGCAHKEASRDETYRMMDADHSHMQKVSAKLLAERDSLKHLSEGLVEALENLNNCIDAYWNNGRGAMEEKDICGAQVKSAKLLEKWSGK